MAHSTGHRLRVKAAVAAAALAALLAACSSGSTGSSASSGGASAGAPKPGVASGTLTGAMSSGAIDTMDPNRWYFAVTWGLANAMCTTLVRYADKPDAAGTQLVPGTASMPVISSNGLTYTFTLRPGARFSDGKPITGQDIKYTFMRLMNPAIDTGTGYYFTNVIGAPAYLAGTSTTIAGIVATTNTVTFHLTAPDGAFLYKAALPTTCPVPAGTPMKPDESGSLEMNYASGAVQAAVVPAEPADRDGLQQELRPGARRARSCREVRVQHRRGGQPGRAGDPGRPAGLPDLEPGHGRHHPDIA